jgi:HEAT repeat protein
MKKDLPGLDFVVQKNARGFDVLGSRCVRLGLIAAMGASLALNMSDAPRAQQRFKEPVVKVTGVTTSGNVVTISADGSLNHAQTWQDPGGDFHIVLVNGQAEPGAARGVRVQHVGNSLELVVPVKRGSSVTVQPRGNRLDLVVTGGTGGALNVENFPVEQRQERAARQETPAPREEQPNEFERGRSQATRAEARRHNEVEMAATTPPQTAQAPAAPSQAAQSAGKTTTTAAPQPPAQEQNGQPAQSDVVNISGATQTGAATMVPINSAGQSAPANLETGRFDLLSFLFSLPALLVLMCVALAGAAALYMRRRQSASGEEDAKADSRAKGVESEVSAADEKSAKPFQHFKGDRRKSSLTVPFERRTSGRGAEDEATRRSHALAAEGNSGASQPERADSKALAATGAPSVLFGSYRIEQEVAHLIAGEPHSTEVLASRASDDRRAVETSLLKALRAPETDDDGRRRVRTALEDYGYVARSCASLLLGGETFERVSAARTLADMKSAQALPFLTEALYDPDPIVRNECVQSLGSLGLPSAIGALLDVARRHQDVPSTILGPALTACSVESLELSWDSPAVSSTFAEAGEMPKLNGDARMIAPAVERYEELPELVEDETLSAALVRLQSTDAESRVNAAQQLAQFQVRCAVAALSTAARDDSEPAVRSAAVTSLGLVNHESVFAPVIRALADEAREVRAAAARALSRLSFDRADAYVRLVETADARTVCDVAHACVKAGLAAQAVGRLTSEDRRQAYESFSLLSLCVRGGAAQPVIDAVECHRDIDTRLTCIQLLSDSNDAEVAEQLRRLAGNGGVPERVRRSILDTVARVAEPQPVAVG